MAQRFTLGNLVIDREAYEVYVGASRVRLTYSEFELLSLLAQRAGAVVPRQELARALWGELADDHRLNVQVCRLRKKLEQSEPWRVKTVRRRGYALVEANDGAEA
jgi:DNA-binding response OmpR family regulator